MSSGWWTFFYSLCYSVQSLRPQIYIFFFNCLLIITEKKIVLSLRKFGLLGLLGWQRSCLLSWSRMRASVKRNCEGGNRKCNWARISPACEITRLIDPFALLLRVACPWHFVMISVYWRSYDEIINYFKKYSTSKNEKPAQHLDP